MRHIFTGTVTKAQLNQAGNDLRDSYFGPDPETQALLVMDGLDFRGRDLRNMTMVDGYVRNCDFSTARTDYLYSRRMQWEPSNVFPKDCSSLFNPDMVAAILIQALGQIQDPGVELVRDHVGANLMHSWEDSEYRLIHELGFTPEKIKTVFSKAFAGFPKLLARLEETLTTGDFAPPSLSQQGGQEYPLLSGKVINFKNLPTPTHRDDRYEIERLLEDKYGGCYIHIHFLEPWVWWNARWVYDLPYPPPWGWWRQGEYEI